MEIFVIFGIIFIVLFLISVFGVIFTSKGRKLFLKLSIGEIIKDYGVLGEGRYYYGKQKLRLFKCMMKDRPVFVLEVEDKNTGGINVKWIVIENETASKMIKAFEDTKSQLRSLDPADIF